MSSAQLPRIETSPRQVRILYAGEWIVDTTKALYVWEHNYYPVYYFQATDVPTKFLRASGKPLTEQGDEVFDVGAGNTWALEAAVKYGDGNEVLKGLVKLDMKKLEGGRMFEEDEVAYGHPKDPYKRVDVLQSSRHVRVVVGGVEVAQTTKPRLLFETMLRTRYYIPLADTRSALFVESQTTSECPYKGVANYYSIALPDGRLFKDVIWYYRGPNAECGQIAGCVCFYHEQDGVELYVDGERAQ
ncbi:DUF427-domain-containing protein [Auricularia subglabra TFB-10046 SS5]|nr:DUF427-domain-containing protein [Auricularia subglabra TFB-10046 SS5]